MSLSLERAETSRSALAESASWLASVQLPNGMIPWYRGGHADAWNHVEAAMALSAHGERAAAERAYAWLASTQREDGSWHAYYASDGSIEEERLDTNVVAYVACGVYQHTLATRDLDFTRTYWPVVNAALEFVLSYQRSDGAVVWSASPAGTPGTFALLAASSSIRTSLRAGAALAAALGARAEQDRYALAGRALARALRRPGARFSDRSEFAMDWYYPVLAGVLGHREARRRLKGAWPTFYEPGAGVRCRSDGRWVTTAETAECAIACASVGLTDTASELLGAIGVHRRSDGAFHTGLVYPERTGFPAGEVTAYSTAAYLLARDVLTGGPTARLFARRRPG